jgi:TolA-binding protein
MPSFLTHRFSPVKLLICPAIRTSEGKSVRAQTRHQLKQDAFSRATIEAAERTADWTVEHRSTLIVAIAVAVIVLAAVGGGWYYLSAQNEKASLEFSQAVRTLETPLRPAGTPPQPEFSTFDSAKARNETAKKQLQAILDKYPHTHTADMAHYLLAVTDANLSDTADAERNFKQVASSGGREISSLARFALASLYAQTSRTKDAIHLYEELISKPTASVSKVTAQLQLADLYQSSNRPLDAKRIYELVKKENPNNEAGQLATQKLAELK